MSTADSKTDALTLVERLRLRAMIVTREQTAALLSEAADAVDALAARETLTREEAERRLDNDTLYEVLDDSVADYDGCAAELRRKPENLDALRAKLLAALFPDDWSRT